MRRTALVAIAVLVVVAAGLVVSGAFSDPGAEPGAEPEAATVSQESLVHVDGEYELWPYTSRSESVEGRTLAINVVFNDDPDAVRQSLRRDAGWEEMDDEEHDADPDLAADLVTTEWEEAHGSVRYTYFEQDGEGEWVDESYQLHDGEYLGTRDHIRVYESPDGAFSAAQVHREYYDWFRLRHTVYDITESAHDLEDDYIAADATVTREHYGIEGGWSDGWLSVIELALLIPLAGALFRRETREDVARAASDLVTEAKRHADAAILGVGLAAVYLGVRAAGIGLETAFPSLGPKAIAAPLYLVLAIGLPALALTVGERCREPLVAFAGAAVGLGLGFFLDFAGLGVAVPVDLIAHRVALLGAIGLVAAGRSADDRGLVLIGLAAWVVGLALPLADVI